VITEERQVRVEAVRSPRLRDYGSVQTLSSSIVSEGLHRPVTLWSDGTLISGGRRHHAHLLLGRRTIAAVFVDTIEDAAVRLLDDSRDGTAGRPWKWSEICRLWALMRKLDEPAAVGRLAAARQLAVKNRTLTKQGLRRPGREKARSDDYVLSVLRVPFGMSEANAGRLWAIYAISEGLRNPDRQKDAVESLRMIDAGEASIWACYKRLLHGQSTPLPRLAVAQPAQSTAAAQQLAVWERALPQLEGLTSGLAELGPPNPDLTWEQVSPAHVRLAAVRRNLEKIIKQMKGVASS